MQRKIFDPNLELRPPRIDREEVVEVYEDENSHLWAVAYSDLLMVLLSFFILFYSTDTGQQRQNMLLDLARGLASEPQVVKNGAGSGGMGTAAAFADLAHLKSLNISVVKEKENLVLNFSNELFRPGRYTINKDQASEINRVLDVIIKYKDHINIYFEGHADSKQILRRKNSIVQDNFVLSSLRATHALQLAKQRGFSEKQLFAQANSSNTRNSRSLSLRIEPIAARSTEDGRGL